MNNKDIADILMDIARMLEAKGENRFKSGAYEKAARVIEELTYPVSDAVRENRLTSIEGIGKSLAAEIKAIVETGESPTLVQLFKEFPPTILEIIEISGLGPKKAVMLYKESGIASLEDLERAARGGLLRHAKGFGPKSEENILKGIEMKKFSLEQTSIGVALPALRKMLQYISQLPGIVYFSESGEVRRRRETVKSIDILVGTETPERVVPGLAGLPYVREVDEENKYRTIVTLNDGLKVTVTFSPPEHFGAALVETTGSETHLETLRARLVKKGFLLKHRCLHSPENQPVAARDESDVYRVVELPWIPPEMREDGLEIEAAAHNTLPVPISLQDLKGDLQMHSTFSDGVASIGEMAEKAMELGYSYIAITDHSRSLAIARGLTLERIKEQHEEIDRLNAGYAGQFRIFKASEVDILADGSLDYPDEVLETMDFVLASVHSRMKMPVDEMTERIIKAVRHPLVNCLGHPSGRLIGRRSEYEVRWEKVFEAALSSGTALEINSHPSRLDLNAERARTAGAMGIPILINTDAHSPFQMELIEYGVYVARRAWLRKEDVLNTRSLGEIEAWLGRNR